MDSGFYTAVATRSSSREMIQQRDQRQEGGLGTLPGINPKGSEFHHLSRPPLPSLPSLDPANAADLIAMADTAKRLELHPISNLLFAHVAHGLGDDLAGKLFIEERTVQGYLHAKPHRYYDLFSLQLSEPKAYLCIPYPLVNPAMAVHFEAIALPTPQVIHARKFPWTTIQERNAEAKKLTKNIFGHFSEDADIRGLITTAGTVLEFWESRRCVRQLHDVALRFFKGKLPVSLRDMEIRN